MRTELMEEVATTVNGYHLRPQIDYDYANARRRMIFEALTQGVQFVCNNAVDGDVAEFGTMTGFSTYSIARAMAYYQDMYAGYMRKAGVQRKVLRLFDSFEGLPRPDHEVDREAPNVQSGRWRESDFKGLTPDELLALCGSTYDKERIQIHSGWFRDTLATIPAATKFAMLHLDCDLYSSTAEVLDYVFTAGLVADGCVIFFDDWNCNRASPRFGQRRAWGEAVEKHRIENSDGGDYAVLGHRFIIHRDR